MTTPAPPPAPGPAPAVQGAQILALEDELQMMRDQGAMTGGTASYPQGSGQSLTGSAAGGTITPAPALSPTAPPAQQQPVYLPPSPPAGTSPRAPWTYGRP